MPNNKIIFIICIRTYDEQFWKNIIALEGILFIHEISINSLMLQILCPYLIVPTHLEFKLHSRQMSKMRQHSSSMLMFLIVVGVYFAVHCSLNREQNEHNIMFGADAM